MREHVLSLSQSTICYHINEHFTIGILSAWLECSLENQNSQTIQASCCSGRGAVVELITSAGLCLCHHVDCCNLCWLAMIPKGTICQLEIARASWG